MMIFCHCDSLILLKYCQNESNGASLILESIEQEVSGVSSLLITVTFPSLFSIAQSSETSNKEPFLFQIQSD